VATAIDDGGVVAVFEQIAHHVDRWANGVLTTLRFPDDWGAYPEDVGPTGAIAGWEWMPDGTRRAFLATGNDATRLPMPAGATACTASAVNGAGLVVGGCDASAVAWSAAGPTVLPLGPGSTALDVTDGGLVCGTRVNGKYAEGWVLRLATGQVQTATPDADHFGVRLVAVNDAGVAVGTAFGRNARSQALRFVNGKVEYLKDLVDPPAWPLDEAVDVNARGDILVKGMDASGKFHAAVLHPR
jgi:uncharacterized membrane protein